jgi:hypothetical protein
MHGLTGSILHGDEGREEVKLDDTRGVSIKIDKRN